MTVLDTPPPKWRTIIKVHPAADEFPLLEGDGQFNLRADINAHDQKVPLVFWRDQESNALLLIDGRNRLDAIEILFGRVRWEGEDLLAQPDPADFVDGEQVTEEDLAATRVLYELVEGDPHEIVLSFNVHRRHLSQKQRRELIAALVEANPEKSDRQIAATAKSSHPTVAAVRQEMEESGYVENLSTRTDSKGRQQPASKKPKSEPPTRFSSGKSAPKSPSTAPAQARDKEIADTASKLASLTGPKLAQTIEDQVRLISDVKWSTISDARRGEIARLVRKMLERIEPENGGLRAEAPMAAEVTDERSAA